MALYTAAVILLGMIFMLQSNKKNEADSNSERVVALNEIEQLYLSGENEKASECAEKLKEEMRSSQPEEKSRSMVLIYSGAALCFGLIVFGYVYFSVLRPFEKMKRYTDEIAKGNFDLPLNYERSNYFGDFTWSFDSMRREITKARRCEREAIENNKTVIATISHDIKTPIASIRAYAEGLEANLDQTPEIRAKYLSVLMRKCDEVSSLTNDLFLHSLADLDKLKIHQECFELSAFIKQAVDEITNDSSEITLELPEDKINVMADRNRLMQLCENLINNSRKYAGTKIMISVSKEDDNALIGFRDFGGGIPDEDMPFITDKFYRGRNCGRNQGSGLGLYIVKYICESSGGSLRLINCKEGGLLAEVRLPVSS